MIAMFAVAQPSALTFAASEYEDEYEYIELLSVTIPLSLDFVIDPFEIANRGMIYSDEFVIENHGTNDVILYISDITVIYDDSEIIPLTKPFSGGFSDTSKSIYLVLDLNRPDVTPPIIATANNRMIEIPLYTPNGNEDDSLSRCTLSLSGNVNPHPDKEWVSGDVKINVSYLLEEIVNQDESDTSNNSGGINEPEQPAKPEDPIESDGNEDPLDPDQTGDLGDTNEHNEEND